MLKRAVGLGLVEQKKLDAAFEAARELGEPDEAEVHLDI